PWRPQIVQTGQGVHLLLDATRSRSVPESDGLVGSNLALADLVGARSWQVTIRNHGLGAGLIPSAGIFLAARTSPRSTDTDGDAPSDYREVTLRVFRAEIDDVVVERPLVTSPVAADTDGDGLADNEEWDGMQRYGFITDPTDPDTDRDGLSDLDEVQGLNRKPTNPLRSDTDDDGVIDGLDL